MSIDKSSCCLKKIKYPSFEIYKHLFLFWWALTSSKKTTTVLRVQGTMAFWFLVLECFWKKYDMTTFCVMDLQFVSYQLPLLKIVFVWVHGVLHEIYDVQNYPSLTLRSLCLSLPSLSLSSVSPCLSLSLCIPVCLAAFPNLPTPSASFTVLWYYHPVTGKIKWWKKKAWCCWWWKFYNRRQQKATTAKSSKLHIEPGYINKHAAVLLFIIKYS